MSLEVNEKTCKRCGKNMSGELHSTLYCSRVCQKEDWKCSKNENNEIDFDEPSYTVISRPQEIMLVGRVKPKGTLLNSDMVNQKLFDTYLNTSLEVKLCSHVNPSTLSFATSASNEYFASLYVMQDSPTVKITVYQFKLDQICINWQGDFPLSVDEKYVAVIDTDEVGKLELEGSLMNDGETLFLHISSDYSHCLHLLIKDKGSSMTWVHPERKGQQFKCRDYQFSDDERYFFIVGTEEVNIARTIESYPIEAYSTTNWELVKKWSVECDYKRTVTNVKLLGPLYFDKSIYVAIKSDHSERSLIQDLINDVTITLPIQDFNYNSSRRVWVSKGGNNLVALPTKKGSLNYWDLTNPTYHPFQECTLLGVESEQDIVTSKHEYLCRFSPNGEVITIISANDRLINIQIMLTWNFQIIDHISIDYSTFNGYQVLSVGMSESSGLLIFGAIFPPYPSAGAIRVVASSVPGIYDYVSKAEKYFDTISKGISAVDCELFASWEVMAAYNKLSVTPKSTSPDQSPVNDIVRDNVYELMFLSNNCYDPGTSLELDAAEKVIQLLSFSYPWNEACKVHVFAVKCNHTLTIIAVRFVKRHGMPGDFTEMCIRILYTDHNIFGSSLTLEIAKCKDHYFLTIEHKSELRTYSGILHATKTSMVITDFNIKCDAKYDIFAISDSRNITLPNDWFVSPNNIITSSSTFCGYIPNFGQDGNNGLLRFGSRKRSVYSAPKLEIWLIYNHRDRESDNVLDEQFINIVSNNYDSIFEDMNYDNNDWLFPCVFAGAMNVDAISNSNLLTDEFLKQYHQSKELVMKNTMTITYCISAVCRIQPTGVRSFLNYIALWDMDVEDRIVNVRSIDESKKNENFIKKKFEIIRESDKFIEITNFIRKILKNISKNETLMGIVNFIRWRLNPSLLYDMFSLMKYQRSNQTTYSTVTKYTLPLAGFCSYKNEVFKLPKWNYKLDSRHNSLHQMAMLSLGQVTTLISNQAKPHHSFAESPFSCLIDEILDIKDEDLMLDFFEIIWLKKLLNWKLDTFAKRRYLERLLIPMLINLLMHLLSGILMTQGNVYGAKVTASLQLIVIIYLGLHESIQLATRPKYWKSFINYIDLTAIILAFIMIIRVLSDKPPSGEFIGFSTAIIWADMILQFRFYKPVGVLLIVLKDMVKEIFGFLILLTTLLFGFAFMPFFILRNETSNSDSKTNSFVNFGSALVEMIKFLGNDFDSLKPWDDRASIQFFRILFIIMISLLFLSMLIVLLNLHVKSITKKGQIKWLKQVSEMIVDIEKYLLTPWERSRVDWFPTWFTYNVTEAESAEWEKMIELKEKEWSFNESKDYKDSKDDKTKNKIETLEQSLDEIKLILEQLRAEAREKNENHS
ncbi:unnamed protein product [Rhizophagus irregularis]|uniref:Ion transport domain-containing protein n=1 Tax=Rhizophagus irregularis TaxID=588596 RepID=A0A2N1MLF4_9GLOM|nr:hypothetical protein RhiirC2_759556 [Rhizophagus irregularis]CAB4373498.1 unnamed protein product [Rhizophagus irregularis]CAB5356985.1 unnamed protein product [Rhizophagus irregularis]